MTRRTGIGSIISGLLAVPALMAVGSALRRPPPADVPRLPSVAADLDQRALLIAPAAVPDGFRLELSHVMPAMFFSPGDRDHDRPFVLPPWEQVFVAAAPAPDGGPPEKLLLRYQTWPSAAYADRFATEILPGNRGCVWRAGRCTVGLSHQTYEGRLSAATARTFRAALPGLPVIERAKLTAGILGPLVEPGYFRLASERYLTERELARHPLLGALPVGAALFQHAALNLASKDPRHTPTALLDVLYLELSPVAPPADRARLRGALADAAGAAHTAAFEDGALFVEITCPLPDALAWVRARFAEERPALRWLDPPDEPTPAAPR